MSAVKNTRFYEHEKIRQILGVYMNSNWLPLA